jgi:hypothetical protein
MDAVGSTRLAGAHRWIFAKSPLTAVESNRPRIVNPERFMQEEEFWLSWDEANGELAAE